MSGPWEVSWNGTGNEGHCEAAVTVELARWANHGGPLVNLLGQWEATPVLGVVDWLRRKAGLRPRTPWALRCDGGDIAHLTIGDSTWDLVRLTAEEGQLSRQVNFFQGAGGPAVVKTYPSDLIAWSLDLRTRAPHLEAQAWVRDVCAIAAPYPLTPAAKAAAVALIGKWSGDLPALLDTAIAVTK